MRIRMLVLAVTVLGAAAACRADADPDGAQATAADTAAEAVAVTPPRDPGAEPAAARAIEIAPLAGQQVSGQAVLLPVGVQTQVTVEVLQAAPGASLTAHVVSGSCARPGPMVADLQPVSTDASGRGSSRIAVDVTMAVLGNGNHAVVLLHDSDGGATAVACGEIPAGEGGDPA